MAELARGFSRGEFQRRAAALQARMDVAGMDALLLASAADIFYITGFLTRFWESPARPWFVVLPQSGDPVAVIPSIGAELMGQSWLSDIRTWQAPCPGDDGVSLLAQTIRELSRETGIVGTPMGLETHLRMPVADYERVMAQVAPRQFVDATAVVQRVREIKSDAEVDKIRAACRVADATFARIDEFAEIGRPLEQVFRDFQRMLLQQGADWVSYTAGGAGPGGYGDVISPAGPRPLMAGDVLMLDTGAVREGYFCDFDRNWAIGQAGDGARRAYDALFGATEQVLSDLRPGMLACDAHHILEEALLARGAKPLGGRLGHGLGVTLTEWPSFMPQDTTELRAGMVLTIEPGVEIAPGVIQVHEENIVLRDEGAELLSRRAPDVLPVLR